ncbi:unnamed protein product [Rhizophagus irregularis]|nr:unnamed protein product [Rhizophagus irregularis]
MSLVIQSNIRKIPKSALLLSSTRPISNCNVPQCLQNSWQNYSNDYEKLFETEIGYDITILSLRISNEWAEKKDGKFIFKKPNISPQLFNIILRFIYCGNIELKNLQGPDVLKLLIAVDELNIHPLVSHIQEF